MSAPVTASWLSLFQAARDAAAPILCVSTSDPSASLRALVGAVAAEVPVISSDSVRGLVGANRSGAGWLSEMLAARSAGAGADPFGAIAAPGPMGTSVVEAAEIAGKLPEGGIWAVYDADVLLTSDVSCASAVRSVCLLRDSFKATARSVVLLGAGWSGLPSRLGADGYYLVDALPRVDELRSILSDVCVGAESAGVIRAGWSDAIPAAADAARGLSRFAAEQAAAVGCVRDRALVARTVAESKADVLRSARGLIPEFSSETFADLGGQARVSWWADSIMRSERRPSLLARIEELEKVLGSAGSDSSGVQSDALAVLLQSFEDRGWSGMVALGPGGSGKSGFSKAMAATYGLPSYRVDLGGMRSRYVGDSEERIRLVVDQISAMSDDRVFVVASCNSLLNLPGPLLRRFRAGIWFFDLPSLESRREIVAKQCRAFKLDPASFPPEMLARPYSGAEIRNLCDLVAGYGVSWQDAASLITPLYVSDAQTIARLRADAKGRYLDAAAPGFYPGPSDGPGSESVVPFEPAVSAGRRFAGGA